MTLIQEYSEDMGFNRKRNRKKEEILDLADSITRIISCYLFKIQHNSHDPQ